MKKETTLIHAGRSPLQHKGVVNTPVYRTSTVLFPNLKAYHDAEKGKAFYKTETLPANADYSYGITGTPTHFALQETLNALQDVPYTLLFPSGLSAITTTLLSLTKIGDHILIPDNVYGPTRRFCTKELAARGITVTYYDPCIGTGFASLIKENTTVIFTESPGSLTFEISDIPAIVKAAKKRNIPVIMDNSWATPLYFDPFALGVDMVVYAGTKYFAGHADVLIGSVSTKDEAYAAQIFQCYRNLGISLSPDDCYLTARGLRTLAVRLKQHQENALHIASHLKKYKEVARILHPALPSHPQHRLWKRDFTGSTGLFSIILDKDYSQSAIAAFVDHLSLFGIGCSWGGYESLILPFNPTAIRTSVRWQEKGSCIRLYIGLEHPDDLIADLEEGFRRLRTAKN